MKFRHFFIFSLVAVFFSSCTIQQHIQFNKNLSGTVTSTIDMSMLMALMPKTTPGDSSTTKPKSSMPDMSMLMDSLKKGPQMDKLKDIKGISNFTYNMDKETKKMTFSYDFKNLDALNKALAQGGTSNPGALMGKNMPGSKPTPAKNKDFKYFVKKGRYITYKMPKNDMPDDMGKNMQENPMMSGDMVKFEFKISFARKIKKVKTKSAIFKSDNYIEYKTNIQEMMKQKDPVEIKIKYR
ncbi:hypothetical protein [uncultured Microscilla sp.]|uniref:hypothetical protein n=1 Tax=uncultured Microscilla sp. TaxID=432653 RepID=UPI0026166AB4|nr:hypothetical protein [uncultured Microscilla sp.]